MRAAPPNPPWQPWGGRGGGSSRARPEGRKWTAAATGSPRECTSPQGENPRVRVGRNAVLMGILTRFSCVVGLRKPNSTFRPSLLAGPLLEVMETPPPQRERGTGWGHVELGCPAVLRTMVSECSRMSLFVPSGPCRCLQSLAVFRGPDRDPRRPLWEGEASRGARPRPRNPGRRVWGKASAAECIMDPRGQAPGPDTLLPLCAATTPKPPSLTVWGRNLCCGKNTQLVSFRKYLFIASLIILS